MTEKYDTYLEQCAGCPLAFTCFHKEKKYIKKWCYTIIVQKFHHVYCCVGKESREQVPKFPHIFDATPVCGVCLSPHLIPEKKKAIYKTTKIKTPSKISKK